MNILIILRERFYKIHKQLGVYMTGDISHYFYIHAKLEKNLFKVIGLNPHKIN